MTRRLVTQSEHDDASWLPYMRPGEHHRALQHLVGEWSVRGRMWLTPDSPAIEFTGTAHARAVLDGRFVLEEIAAQLRGLPFHGLAIHGHDNFKGQYVSVWCSSGATSISVFSGHADRAGRRINYEAELDHPMSGERGKKVQSVITILDDVRQYEMNDTQGGRTFTTLEITYVRASTPR